jgi:CBS domain-containing protein
MRNMLKAEPCLSLGALMAADLMTANPVSIRDEATVKEAVAMLADKKFSAAPVIDHAGRPVGVLSRADLVIHMRETVDYAEPIHEYYDADREHVPEGFQVEKTDYSRVSDIMTPVVFSVRPDTPADKIVEEMLSLKVHRLFVVGHDGVLIGVVSTLDILRALKAEEPVESW